MHLLQDLTNQPSILELSKNLNQKYPQTYNSIKQLEKENIIHIDNLKNNKRIHLNLKHLYTLQAEIERTKQLPKEIKLLQEKLPKYPTILFGSQTKKYKDSSDIDLLVLSSKNQRKIEEEIYNALAIYTIDLHILTKEDLILMWNSNELNIGNEILKNHIILQGFQEILNLFAHELEKRNRRINQK